MMEWTIEKIRQLPEDNWLGIKRVGEHAWQIGGDRPGEMMIYTGDGGVLEYCKSFEEYEYVKDFVKKYYQDGMV